MNTGASTLKTWAAVYTVYAYSLNMGPRVFSVDIRLSLATPYFTPLGLN